MKKLNSTKDLLAHGQREITDRPELNRGIVILLDMEDGRYNTEMMQYGLRMSEMISLLEIMKADLLSRMIDRDEDDCEVDEYPEVLFE